ncbi:uncharacterized protein LOC124459994 [Drosophila willistoni]|uniref:uncharacterized protein LOC124459994 n=1 Tax=Drosophila willistoni TaxID=7260 RepID=UPI001F086ADF|nr:uncharacterized protein LOC124459994 [Drosophila willistoni]
MCGFGFMAYGFDCCHRSIDFSLMPSIGKPTTKKPPKKKSEMQSIKLKRQNKQFVMRANKTDLTDREKRQRERDREKGADREAKCLCLT